MYKKLYTMLGKHDFYGLYEMQQANGSGWFRLRKCMQPLDGTVCHRMRDTQ